MSLKSKASSNNQRAREMMLAYNLHEHDIQFALDYFMGCCAYCGIEFQDYFEIDHIIPISNEEDDEINLGSVAYNIVPCCTQCNQSKGTQDLYIWLRANRNNLDEVDEIYYRITDYQVVVGIDEVYR